MPPPQRSTSLDPIAFKDFSPGIADNPGVSYQPETATRANTWRCIANRSGALVPLPWRTEPFTVPTPSTDPNAPYAVNGLYAPPIGVFPTVLFHLGDEYPAHELMVGIQWDENIGSGPTAHQNLYRVRRYEQPLGTAFDLIHSATPYPMPASFIPSGMGFGTTRSNQADHTIVGTPVVVALWCSGFASGYLLCFPDDQHATTNTPYVKFSEPTFLLDMCCHQGRTIVQEATAYNQGVDTTTFMGENLLWSKVNTFSDWTPNADPAVAIHAFPQAFVPENPSGYAFMAAMSANELFAVKLNGAVNVVGDLDNPTVVSLPMVAGSEISHTPAICELGVVYGSRTSGVWLWPHGDTSQLLSPRMIPDFWAITPGSDDDAFGGVAYQFARCDDWVLVPNNWIFDTNLKSWWRLEDPDVAQIRLFTSMSHFIYGSESFYSPADNQPIHLWKREDKGPTYSWQSHPIWQSVADIVNVNEIEVIAEGQGTITVTLTALNGDHHSITLALANCGYPERFREAFAIQGTYLQLRIEVDSGIPLYAPAPTVYSVTLYPFSEQPVGHRL
jgi:hypothetical protein